MSDLIGSLVVLFVLFLLSGFFSSAETAYTSLSRIKLENEAKNGSKIAQKILALVNDSQKLFTIILLGNNIVNIAAASVSTYVVMKLVESEKIAVLISTFGITFIVLIFGEIVPKSFAAYYPYELAKKYHKWLKLFYFVFRPIIMIVNFITSPVLKSVKSPKMVQISEDEFKHILEKSKDEGTINKDAKELISNAVDFKNVTVSEILTPRVDIERIEEEKSILEGIEYANNCGFSRIPVIKDSVDNIIGVAYLKDMIKTYLKDPNKAENIKIKDIMRTPYRIPEDKNVNDLLREMRKLHFQMAIVIDEYGGTEGLVTIEDILEEIVGEIRDEYDTEQDDIIEHNKEKNILICTGRTDIGDINDLLNISLPDNDYETIGGLIFNELGRLAKKDDEVLLDNVKIKVVAVDDVNIRKVELSMIEENED